MLNTKQINVTRDEHSNLQVNDSSIEPLKITEINAATDEYSYLQSTIYELNEHLKTQEIYRQKFA